MPLLDSAHGCLGSPASLANDATQSSPIGAADARADAAVAQPSATVCRVRVLLGTWVAIEAEAQSRDAGLRAIDQAFAAMVDVERLMHPQRAGSDLSKIGGSPLHSRVEVDASTWRVLQQSKIFHEWSGGVFDPCLPSRPGRLSDVEIGPEPWVLCHQPVAIDLGGIAKGYAVDRAVNTLQAFGCTSGIVNAGGDLRVFGSKPQAVMLRRPDGTYDRVELIDSALAASDPNGQSQPAEHQGYYVRQRPPSQPASGRHSSLGTDSVTIGTVSTASVNTVLVSAGSVSTGVVSARSSTSTSVCRPFAAVIASDAMTADALTKCALLCSELQVAELLQRTGARCLPAPES